MRRRLFALVVSAISSLCTVPLHAEGAKVGPPEGRIVGRAFADVASKIRRSVVQIDVAITGAKSTEARWSRDQGNPHALGSGIVYSQDGAILTNNHVIEDARSIYVRLSDGRVLPASVVGRDPAADLAVLRVPASAGDLAPLPIANSDEAQVGEWVLAIGCPLGLSQTITVGVLSAKGRGVGVNAVEDYLQTDASINPGNSGGPLVNMQGEVLGINTLGATNGIQGIGLAVPSNMAKRVADALLKRGRVDRPWIGISAQDLTPQLRATFANAPREGVVINGVTPHGPADKANIVAGDILTKIDGKQLLEGQDVIRAALAHDVGEFVSLEVVRQGKIYKTRVQLESRNEPEPPLLPVQRTAKSSPGAGFTLGERSLPSAAGGETTFAVVKRVAPDSVADRAGIVADDVIVEANDVMAPTAQRVLAELAKGPARMRIRRGSQTFFTVVEASK